MEDRANRNERNPLPFWLPARSDAFILYFLFFSPSTIVYHIGPGPVRQIVLPKLLVVDLTSFHWLRWVTCFVCGAWWNVTHCYRTDMSVGCLHWTKMLLTVSPRTLLMVPRGLFFILSQILSLNSLPFFINCSFWFWENHQAHTIESFSLLLATLCHPTRSCLSPFCTLFRQNCASRQKRQHCF